MGRHPHLDGLGLPSASQELGFDGAAPGMPFRLSQAFVDAQARNSKPTFGFNGLGELVYQRTYARYLGEDCDDRETW